MSLLEPTELSNLKTAFPRWLSLKPRRAPSNWKELRPAGVGGGTASHLPGAAPILLIDPGGVQELGVGADLGLGTIYLGDLGFDLVQHGVGADDLHLVGHVVGGEEGPIGTDGHQAEELLDGNVADGKHLGFRDDGEEGPLGVGGSNGEAFGAGATVEHAGHIASGLQGFFEGDGAEVEGNLLVDGGVHEHVQAGLLAEVGGDFREVLIVVGAGDGPVQRVIGPRGSEGGEEQEKAEKAKAAGPVACRGGGERGGCEDAGHGTYGPSVAGVPRAYPSIDTAGGGGSREAKRRNSPEDS